MFNNRNLLVTNIPINLPLTSQMVFYPHINGVPLTSPKKGLPVRSCNSMTPNEYTSDSGVSLPMTKYFGSTYAKRTFELLHIVLVSTESKLR